MNELIKIEEKNGIETVNARELHEFLESKQEFSNWIKNRITKYGFIEEIDFTVDKFINGKATQKDYHITLDMAKELSMVENNDKGKEARKYFISIEKKSKNTTDRIDRLENMVEKLCIAVATIPQTILMLNQNKQEYTQDYFSIIAFANTQGIKPTVTEAQNYSRIAKKLSTNQEIEIKKIPDERWGFVNSYHISILKEVFEL